MEYKLDVVGQSMRRSDLLVVVVAIITLGFFVFLGIVSALSPTNPSESEALRIGLLVGFSTGGVLFAYFLLRSRYYDIPLSFVVTEGGWTYQFTEGSPLTRRWDDPGMGLRIRDYGIRNYDSKDLESVLCRSDPITWSIWLTAPEHGRDKGGPIPGQAVSEILKCVRERNLRMTKFDASEGRGEYFRRFTDIRIGDGLTTTKPP